MAETIIPSDLHVLCLPLALILSQDQTLHCIYKKFIVSLAQVKTSRNQQSWDTLLLFCLSFVQNFKELFRYLLLRGAKLIIFFKFKGKITDLFLLHTILQYKYQKNSRITPQCINPPIPCQKLNELIKNGCKCRYLFLFPKFFFAFFSSP